MEDNHTHHASTSSHYATPEEKTRKANRAVLAGLYMDCERERNMHRLSERYFQFRDHYLNFWPLTFLTTFSAILAFMATTELFTRNQQTVFTLFVGISAVFSVGIQTCAKHVKYESRSDMHRMAALGLKKLCDDVNFILLDPKLGLANNANQGVENDKNSDEKGEPNNISAKVDGYRMVYKHVMEACESPIPIPIYQAFLLADSRLTILLGKKKVKKRIMDEGLCSVKNCDEVLFGALQIELFQEITNSSMWPVWLPNTDDTVKRAIESVEGTLDHTYLEAKRENSDLEKGGYSRLSQSTKNSKAGKEMEVQNQNAAAETKVKGEIYIDDLSLDEHSV